MRTLILGSCLIIGSSTLYANNVIEQGIQEQSQNQQQGKHAQKRIDKLDDQTQAMLNDFRSSSLRLEDLNSYNTQMERLVADQRHELEQREQQVRDIELMQQQIVPFLQQMIDVLDEFVQLDTPFLVDERSTRIAQLKQLINRSDITITEKYRRIMEAYRIEAEYGHTMEAYQGMLNGAGEPRQVDFLRLGRVGLYYLNLKADDGGFWLNSTRQWLPLEHSFRDSLAKALRIAKKQTPPDLITLPITAPEQTP